MDDTINQIEKMGKVIELAINNLYDENIEKMSVIYLLELVKIELMNIKINFDNIEELKDCKDNI